MSDYPTLENLFAAYFHQDWAMEHATPDAVVDHYRRSEAPAQVAAARSDLERLLSRGYDEPALGRAVRDLGSEYDPTREGGTWQAWLERIGERLARP